MDVVSVCPLRVATVTWQPARNRHALTVVCRGTFYLREGGMVAADVQLPAVRRDRYLKATGPSSLVAPTDLVPAKRGVDVVLVGRGRAPGGKAVASFGTRLQLGSIDKRIEVFAERFFTPSGELVQAARAAEVPLGWERAAGGPGTDNPVGVSTAQRDGLGRIAMPQLQPPGLRVIDPDEPVEPVGYGPIAPSWPTRQACLGDGSAEFSADRWWARPLPDGFDMAYFNVAPADQRLDEIVGREPLLLENLLESSASLRTRLPAFAPIGTVTRRRAKPEPFELSADTVWIDTDRGICTITWRGRLSLWQPSEQGHVEIDWAEGPPRTSPLRDTGGTAAPAAGVAAPRFGVDPRWLDMPVDDPDGGVTEPSYVPDDDEPAFASIATIHAAEGRPAEGAPGLWSGAENESDTVAFNPDGTEPGRVATLPPLPFQSSAAHPQTGASSPSVRPGGAAGSDGHLRIGASPRESTEVTRLPVGQAGAPPLPFRSLGSSNGVGPRVRVPEVADDPLPFRKSVPPATSSGLAPGGAGRPSSPSPPPLVRAHVGPTVPIPPQRPSSPWAGAEASAARSSALQARASAPGPVAIVAEPAGGEAPSPPPLIGPLATPQMVARDVAPAGPPPPEARRPDELETGAPNGEPEGRLSEAASAEPSDRFEPGPGLRLLRLGACARVAAAIARRPDATAEILDEHALDGAVWKANEAYWAERVREQTSRGRTQLLRDYDAAYVDGLERERGPITAEEYASLVVAAERGQGAAALRHLELPATAMVRIERVFLRRVIDNVVLGERIRRAIEAERDR